MPTENRSSKTEMVSVPRELLERCDFGKNAAKALAALPELRAILARPAEHLGEPYTTAISIPDGYCLMPRRLTAENGAKALLLGEFKLNVVRECPECLELEEPAEGCEICDGEGEYAQHHMIPWDQIKFIYSEAVKGLAIQSHAVLELRSVGATDGQA
ncbi:hypothetical protein [Pseudomonas farsensis]|uniref:Uncharacterized protein n=1 Tax=Pseudomonas farsensis TaxID=2745492 RepID=A0ABU8QN11_9PSED